MTDPTPDNISPQGVPNNFARCHGSGSYEDGEWHWREGCDDCQRRVAWTREDWIDPPPIIVFECEYRIGPDEIVAQGEHAPGPKPLSPAAQSVRRDIAQIMHELHRRCRVSISATDTLPITLETNDASLQAGINSLCAAAIRELKDQVAPHRPIPLNPLEWGEYNMTEIIRERLDAIATELEQLNDPA